jgi:hypothetical protein
MIFADCLKLKNAGVFSVLLFVCTTSKGIGQNAFPNPLNPKQPKAQNVSTVEKLKDKVSINGLPEYSGKQKFITGRMHNTPIGAQYHEEFIAMEPATQILDWYKGALTGYKWEIVTTEPNRVLAKKQDGSSITVGVNQISSPQGRSYVTITYHDYHISPNGNQ